MIEKFGVRLAEILGNRMSNSIGFSKNKLYWVVSWVKGQFGERFGESLSERWARHLVGVLERSQVTCFRVVGSQIQ